MTTTTTTARRALKKGGKGESTIQKVAPRTAVRRKPKLMEWTTEILSEAKDSFHQGVLYLIEKGARQILVLAPKQPTAIAESTSPFVATYAYNPSDKLEVWCGLSLNASLIPDLWKQLATQGVVEIMPTLLSVSSSISDSNTFMKRAFALGQRDYLTIVRCGSPTACTGILAIVSSASLAQELSEAFQVSIQPARGAQKPKKAA